MRIRVSLSSVSVVLLGLVLTTGAVGSVACNTAQLQPEGPIMPAVDLDLDASDDDASADADTTKSSTKDATTDAKATEKDAGSDDDAGDAS